MRIGPSYLQQAQFYNAAKTVRPQQTQTAKFSDKLQISDAGKDLGNVKSAVAGAEDIRAEKIAPIKSAVQDGSYDVDNETFADKMLEKLAGAF